MPYAFINDAQQSTDGAPLPSVSTPAVSISPSNVLVVAARYSNATAQTVAISDTIGTNVYVPITSVYNSAAGNGLAFFYALNSSPGNTIFISTPAVSCTNQGIYVGQYSGITNLITSTGQLNSSPGTGANANTSGNATVGTVPAMLWGFCAPVSNFNVAPTAGTSPIVYNGRQPSWNFSGGTFLALAEDSRVTVSGNYAATFGVNENSSRYVFFAAFQEIIPQHLGATGIFVTP